MSDGLELFLKGVSLDAVIQDQMETSGRAYQDEERVLNERIRAEITRLQKYKEIMDGVRDLLPSIDGSHPNDRHRLEDLEAYEAALPDTTKGKNGG